MSTKSNVDSTSSAPDRPTKRRRLASPIELAPSAPEPALVTPDATVSPITPPLPLTRENLRALTKMSSNPTTPTSNKRRRRSPNKSTSGDTTTNSLSTSKAEAASTSQSKVRQTLRTYRIIYYHEYYSTVPQLKNLVEGIAITLRGSPGLSNEKISFLQRELNKMATTKEDTATDTLIKELFTTPDSRDTTAPLLRLRNCDFIESCIPKPDTSNDAVLAQALRDTKLPANPRPDFTFGIDPNANVFTQAENDVNAVQQVKGAANIVGDLQYPFFVVEWKSSFAGGTHTNAASQCARSGAAIVSSMVRLYRAAFPLISSTELLAKTLSFSSTVDSYSAIIYVHWWEFKDGHNHWNMHLVDSLNFLDRDPLRFRQFRRTIDNIIDWGLTQRLSEIRQVLKEIADAIKLEAAGKGKQKA